MSALTSKNADERSLLEDASTLLMFSKVRSSSNSSSHNNNVHDHQTSGHRSSVSSVEHNSMDNAHPNFQSLPLTRCNTRSGTISPRNPLASPGPASVALLEKDDESDSIISSKSSGASHNTASGNNGNSSKGIVAAAALAAAATVPLPLKTRGRSRNNSETVVVKGEHENGTLDINKRKEWPVPDSYIVDLDAGVISCICGFDDDDGFTIQCDHCNRWQHAVCYNINDIDAAPEEYLCNICDPRKLDVKRAKRTQLERLKYSREHLDNIQSNGSQSIYEGSEYNEENGKEIQSDKNKESMDRRDNKNNSNNNSNYNNNNDYNNHNINKNGNGKSQFTRERNQSVAKDDGSNEISEDETKRKRRREEGKSTNEVSKKKNENITYMSAKDAYSAMYLPLSACEFKDKYVKLFIDKHNDDDWVIPYNKKPFKALNLEIRPYSETGNPKFFPGFTKLGVFSDEDCEENELIEEYIGEVYFQKDYLSDARNHYRIWGTTKPRVIFHPHWPICIDARLCGNITRYIRRSCNPNAEIATIKIPATNEVKFLLRATRRIEKGEEIHIKWQWDLRHPILQIMNGSATLETLNEPDKYLLIHSIHTILGFCDCACGNSKDCNLSKVKKYSQSLYKSVKSKMNNRYKLNEILNQYQGKKRRPLPILARLVQENAANQEKAPKVLADLNTKKLAFIQAEDSADNMEESEENQNVSDSITEVSTKPYKWILLEKDKKGEAVTSETENQKLSANSNLITNPSQYDESGVKDLDRLPIPIVLEVPIKNDAGTGSIRLDSPANYTTGSILTSYRDNTPASTPPIATIIPEHQSQVLSSLPQMPPPAYRVSKLDDKSNSSSSTSLAELSDHARKPLKKKLSFADYRKKQSK